MSDDKAVQAVAGEKINSLEREQLKFDKRMDGVEDKITNLTSQVNSLMSYIKFAGFIGPFILGGMIYVLHQQPSRRLDVLEVKVEKVDKSVNSLEVRFENVERSVNKLTTVVERNNETADK